MSETPYPNFIRETYATVHDNIEKGINTAKKSGKPLLVMVGEEHRDDITETDLHDTYVPPEHQEPALAGAYTEISALESSIRLVGQDNVMLSVEIPPKYLPWVFELIQSDDPKLLDSWNEEPLVHSLRYALENKLEIVPSDVWNHMGTRHRLRQDGLDLSIRAIALEEDKPQIVVHMGGSAHFASFQGYSFEKTEETRGKLTRPPYDSIFSHAYDSVIYFNTARSSPEHKKYYAYDSFFDEKYSTNPANAIQIDAPGRMTEEDKTNMGQKVRAVADEYDMRNNNTPPETALTSQDFSKVNIPPSVLETQPSTSQPASPTLKSDDIAP